jgi:Concanavalin A-like lectin/glucanases superfamily
MRIAECLSVVIFVLLAAASAHTQGNGIKWSFDEGSDATLQPALAKSGDDLAGSWRLVPGVKGHALEFDGYTTELSRAGKDVPALGNAFTVSAWVALDYYPWNWIPIIDQSEFHQVGFSLEIDAFGHVGMSASIDGTWKQVISEETLPLKRWVHVTGTFRNDSGLTILIDGKQAGHLNTTGNFWQASNTPLIIGRVREPRNTFPAWISRPVELSYYSLDGDLDEVGVQEGATTAEEDRAQVTAAGAPNGDVIPTAVLPSGPPGAGPFGADYASLKFEPAWDRLRRIGPDTDVVVRFDKSPMRLVFWQGTNYIPAWVTDNGKWYTDEFMETWGKGCPGAGDCEPMSDKQSRYSHVSILSSTDARAVIHWRYALSEARNYEGANADPRTGWFEWGDEYWTVYPDGVAVRKQVLRTQALDATHEWQESIIINGPGQRPEDNIEPDALTLENMAGETATYHWELKTDHTFSLPKGPAKLDKPADANMQIVRLKSSQNPFEIVWPRGVSSNTYNSEPSYSTFEWWNHWPVAQLVSSGRLTVTSDRASHSSLSHIYWDPYERTADTMTKLLLCGLMKRNGEEANLLPLARSWIAPPEAKLAEAGSGTVKYDPAQRAFVVARPGEAAKEPLTIQIESSAERPLVNPAIVIEGWDAQAKVRVSVDGKQSMAPVRFGIEHHLNGDNAVVYVEMTAVGPVEMRIEPLKP